MSGTFTDINNENGLIYAIKAYDRPNCIISEFESDYKRLKYVKRLLNKYRINKDLKERLILNHIIILANVFGIEAAVTLLFLKVDSIDYSILKTFLIFLNYMPKSIESINGQKIYSSDIQLDSHVVNVLRNLVKEP